MAFFDFLSKNNNNTAQHHKEESIRILKFASLFPESPGIAHPGPHLYRLNNYSLDWTDQWPDDCETENGTFHCNLRNGNNRIWNKLSLFRETAEPLAAHWGDPRRPDVFKFV